MPALVTSAPSPHNPRARARSIQSPDSRVSRPTSTRIVCPADSRPRTSAAPTRATVSSLSGASPALPRMPSVPNNFIASPLLSSPSPSWFAAPGRARTHRPTPTVTTSRTVASRSLTEIGSVIASLNCFSALSGPDTSTASGSDLTLTTSNPRAGAPSIVGCTRTILIPVVSNSIVRVGGDTWTVSRPYGVLTCPGVRWNSRRPVRAARRSITADTSPVVIRLSVPEDPRTRTSTVSGGLLTISSSEGRFCSSIGTRSTRSTTRSPATTSQSRLAMQIDSIFSPKLRMENDAMITRSRADGCRAASG